MTPEDADRIEQTHRATVGWQAGVVGWQCLCGNPWPCRLLQLADDVRRAREAWSRDFEEFSPGEFWSR
jgi:hypothetical protein